MTYDYSVAKPGPIGPISWTEKTLKYAISIMSPSKVYIGLPGYGRVGSLLSMESAQFLLLQV